MGVKCYKITRMVLNFFNQTIFIDLFNKFSIKIVSFGKKLSAKNVVVFSPLFLSSLPPFFIVVASYPFACAIFLLIPVCFYPQKSSKHFLFCFKEFFKTCFEILYRHLKF
jgi:hypothetical protein